jgi:hypothetical protein
VISWLVFRFAEDSADEKLGTLIYVRFLKKHKEKLTTLS